MSDPANMTTVFRSLDETAQEEALRVHDLLASEGLSPVVLDDTAPDVIAGTYEVRVPAGEAARADELVASEPGQDEVDEPMTVDPTSDLDLETVLSTDGTTGEMEATGVCSVLTASGISAFLVGASSLPNLGFEVRVPKEDAEKARQVIAEAQAAGPAAAEEAERATEPQP